MKTLTALVFCSFASWLPATANAALDAQSTTPTGRLLYEGMGDIGGGVGSGRYTLGDCLASAASTTCTMSGNYVETAASGHAPNQTGTFTLILSYPGSGPSPVLARSVSPGSDVLQFSTTGAAVFTLTLHPSSGGQIVGIYPAPVFADSITFATFLGPGTFSCSGLAASDTCSVGRVGLVPGAAISGSVSPLQFSLPGAVVVTPSNYQGLWWAAPAGSESGWGINFTHQGDTIFASWFTYDAARKGLWLVMTAQKTADSVYGGTLFTLTGPSFDTVPFPALGTPGGAVATPVGSATLTFNSDNDVIFAYTVSGVAQTKSLTRQVFGTLPTCVYSANPDFASASNYQDLWWAVPGGSESGWGVNLTHQGDKLFASWFTYDHDRTPMWLVATADQTAAGTFAGELFRTTGPPFSSVPFPAAGMPGGTVATSVGSVTFTFTGGSSGKFRYTVNGVTQTKDITRELFDPPAGTLCR